MAHVDPGRPMEILLIEDSLLYARITIEALDNSSVQHRLTLVVDGEEAMEFLRREGRFSGAPRPDVVLLDLTLPKKDGREVLHEIKFDPNLNDLPVIVLTGSDDQEDSQNCQLLGVDGYLMKPFEVDQFIALVKRLKQARHLDVLLPPTY